MNVAFSPHLLRLSFLSSLGLAWVLTLHAAPGDGHWDRQFAMPGTGSVNFALRFKGNSLYTGGFNNLNGGFATNTSVSIFDGTNWSTIGEITGSTPVIYDMEFIGSNVYVGGTFSAAGGVPAAGLAKWDGANWSGVGGFDGLVRAMATDGTNLYVGGSFTNAGGVLITNLAKWNGANWSAVGGAIGYYGGSIGPSVYAIEWHNGQLYIGGSFTSAGVVAATNLARWDGSSWSQIGGGVGTVSDLVSTLQFSGNDLYVAGQFTTAGGVSALNIARWNGSTWSALGTGLKAPSVPSLTPVNALAFLGSDLYATGGFTNAGGTAASRVARWNGSVWQSFGAINGSGYRAVSNTGSIYIGGVFNIANYNTPSNVIGDHVIRWDGSTWHGLIGKAAQGTHMYVYALGLGSDGLYAGGLFNAVGATVASRIARWDRTNWFALGNGVSGSLNGNSISVRAIKVRGGEVFVGGLFTTAGSVTANNVAEWNGSAWSTLGYGVDYAAFAIGTTASDVYVGGSFTNAYDSPSVGYTVNRIARWNSSTGWWPLGTGVNGTVSAICVQGSLVYVGGSFTTAGGNTANRIAVWDGANWSSLGTGSANGLGGTVSAILVDGTNVYVGGSFTTAGGATARAVAKWNGSNWSQLGQGMFATSTASVAALAKIGGYLYASGLFTNAGGSVITCAIARWDGTQWEALGSGIGNDLSSGVGRGFALAAWNNDLFVGGTFETAGVIDAGYIARWTDQIDFTPRSTMRLRDAQILPGNVFKFRATATEHAAYVVEYSPNLVNWASLTTNSLSSLDVTNSMPGVNVRTYRMREIP
ncbi:MAG: hypothetical protein ABSH11_13915 [Verrucomicrobiota bacterium]|jgi:hypothetical protein